MESHIWTLLNGHLYSDAIRLAEIYHAEVSTEDSLYYVALCYFKSRKINSTYHILYRANSAQSKCRLLLGQCCYELDKYHEAERAILGNEFKIDSLTPSITPTTANTNTTTTTATINTANQPSVNATYTINNHIKEQLVKFYGNDSSAAVAARYLGLIYEKTSRPKEAIELFRISLDLFPYMWGSVEALSRLADALNDNVTTTNTSNTNNANNCNTTTSITTATTISSKNNNNNANNNNNNNNNNILTTNNSAPSSNSPTARVNFLANALSKFKIDHKSHTLEFNHYNNPHPQQQNDKSTSASNQVYKTPQTRRAPGPVKKEPRRSTRLYSIENNETPATRPTFAGTNAPAKKIRRLEPEYGLDSTAKIFLESFKGLDCLNQYKLDQCISILSELPEKHRNTGWVLSCIARALYEKTDYNESVRYYESARRLEPYRLDGMEYYSSALWHLHKEVKLSILAKELMDFDQDAPETWCVAGNCYSLQKEHESAIKYLEKAIKVDPNFAYAYTLLGHELISAERLDQAKTCFRNAVRLDPRHWNAWCGLGCIFYKSELYANAELYYKKALRIAPTNPVLMCQLAVVQHACKKSDSAIDTLSRALTIDKDNALCRFHRATIYSAIDKNTEALAELDELKRLVPKESMVYFLIGKIHKKMGNTHTALMNFSWAMELDPKGANNTIRDVIDKQHSGDDDVVVHRD